MLKNLKKIFGIKTRYSNVKTFYGSEYELTRATTDLCNNKTVKITSVSATRVDNEGSKGYVDKYLFTISYDYWL